MAARRLLAVLLTASPFLPFLLWPHPEVVTAALVTSSLALRHDGRRASAVLMPLTRVLALGFTVVRLVHVDADPRPGPGWLLAGLALVALASTGAANWNHGTVGPSRYGLWLLPFFFVLLVEAVALSIGRLHRLVLSLAVVAAFTQGAVTLARGGVHARQDYARHSAAARFVLDRWPAVYSPTTETFVERTRHEEINPDLPLTDPVVYRSSRGCRKAWIQKRHLPEVSASCGGSPTVGPDFRALKASRGPNAWAYVNW